MCSVHQVGDLLQVGHAVAEPLQLVAHLRVRHRQDVTHRRHGAPIAAINVMRRISRVAVSNARSSNGTSKSAFSCALSVISCCAAASCRSVNALIARSSCDRFVNTPCVGTPVQDRVNDLGLVRALHLLPQRFATEMPCEERIVSRRHLDRFLHFIFLRHRQWLRRRHLDASGHRHWPQRRDQLRRMPLRLSQALMRDPKILLQSFGHVHQLVVRAPRHPRPGHQAITATCRGYFTNTLFVFEISCSYTPSPLDETPSADVLPAIDFSGSLLVTMPMWCAWPVLVTDSTISPGSGSSVIHPFFFARSCTSSHRPKRGIGPAPSYQISSIIVAQ